MQRELKFRGLDSLKNWVYGLPELPTSISWSAGAIHQFFDNRKYGRSVVVIDRTETITQYTNIKDKNGTEIYDGDIVGIKLEDSVEPKGYFISKCEVKMYRGCWCLFQIGFDYSNSPFEEITILHNEYNELEVLGNIYETN